MRLQALLTALTFAAALAPLVFHYLRPKRSRAGLALSVLWLVVVAGLYQIGIRYRPDLLYLQIASRRPIETNADGYVSSRTCQACHPNEYASWHDSYHRRMTQVARPENVVPDIATVEFSRVDGVAYGMKRVGDTYVASTNDPAVPRAPGEGEVITRPIALVTGSHHEQVFWMTAEAGRRMHLFPFAYRIHEDRWVPYMSLLIAPESVPAQPGDMWNRACLRCHTTHPRPRIEGDRMDTNVGEFGIACEACHGPGQRDVDANRSPLRRYLLHLGDDGDDTITHPGRLSHERMSEICGLCHGVHVSLSGLDSQSWKAHGFHFRPGQDLSQERQIIEYRSPDLKGDEVDEAYWTNHYWRDGMLRVGGREWSSIRETQCYKVGELSCLSCHDLHRSPDDPRPPEVWADDQLIEGYEGRVGQESNQACLQCHEELVGKESAHSHHGEGSEGNSCYNCHMPYQSWGLLKGTRNHQIASPDVRPDISAGRPNACNLCHVDRTLTWTAQKLSEWYGIESPPIEDEELETTATVPLFALRGDAGQRALAAWTMGWEPAQAASGTDWMTPYLAWLLKDPYPAVRHSAAEALRSLEDPPKVEVDTFPSVAQGEELLTRVMTEWRGRRVRATDATHPDVLLDERGDIREDRLRQIASERDDRPLELSE